MEDSKKWYTSKTLWGVVPVLLVSLLLCLGVFSPKVAGSEDIQQAIAFLQDPAAQQQIQSMADILASERSTDMVIGVFGVLSSLLAIYGRFTAAKKLE